MQVISKLIVYIGASFCLLLLLLLLSLLKTMCPSTTIALIWMKISLDEYDQSLLPSNFTTCQQSLFAVAKETKETVDNNNVLRTHSSTENIPIN